MMMFKHLKIQSPSCPLAKKFAIRMCGIECIVKMDPSEVFRMLFVVGIWKWSLKPEAH